MTLQSRYLTRPTRRWIVQTTAWGMFATFAATLPAFAQLSRVGPTQALGLNPFQLASDVAYDAGNNLYLIVGAAGNAVSSFTGVFANAAGGAATAPVHMPCGAAMYCFAPRARYSQDLRGGAGGFLVTWHENDFPPAAGINSVHATIVWYSNGTLAYSGDNRLSDWAELGSYWVDGAALAYSRTSQHILV